jgi:hypothetical protein
MTNTPTIVYDGKAYPIEDFHDEDGEYVKINLTGKDGTVEGIWAAIHDNLVPIYDKGEPGDRFVCSLRNDSIAGLPWGCFVVAESVGPKTRPNSYVSKMTFRGYPFITQLNGDTEPEDD